MLTRRSLLATFFHGFVGSVVSRLIRAFAGPLTGSLSEGARDPRDEPMTFLDLEIDGMGIGQFLLHRRHAPAAELSDAALVVLQFRRDDGMPAISFFTFSAERITLATLKWLNANMGSRLRPSEVERGFRDAAGVTVAPHPPIFARH